MTARKTNNRGNIVTVRIVKYWDRLYREVVAQIGIDILKKKNLLKLLTYLILVWDARIVDDFLCSFQTSFSDSMNTHFQTDNKYHSSPLD